MKNLVLLLAVLLISCGRSNEEQMFFDFMDNVSMKNVNKSVKDLNFKIISLKKVGVIVAKDSMDILEAQLDFLKSNMQERTALIIKDLDSIKAYEEKKNKTSSEQIKANFQKAVDDTQKLIETRREYLDEHELMYKKIVSNIKMLKQDPSLVVSTKYEVSYSMDDPDTNLTATFKSDAYTNAENSKFLIIKDY